MEIIVRIDAVFLAFFNKIARAFARLTGRSNFFLAKCMIWLCIMGSMTVALNYWLPILSRKTHPLAAALFGGNALLFLIDLRFCEKAEESETNDKRVRMFGPIVYWPVFRMCVAFSGLIFVPTAISNLISSAGMLPAKILDESYLPAFAAFLYFAALDPPQVGKSKIREWVEGFANSFRKPAPVSVKRK